MSRRLLAIACALALSAAMLPGSAAAVPASYVHEWQAEGQVGGDLGGSARKKVERAEMTMALDDGRYDGILHYADELVVLTESGGATGQSASIDVTLTGSPAEGGAAAAGTFSGEAILIARGVSALDDVEGMAARSDGVQVVYEVSGHWGARVAHGMATGELLFERATPVRSSAGGQEGRDALWFDRLSPQEGGGAQTFQVEVTGLAGAVEPVDGGNVVAPGSGAADGTGTAGGTAGGTSGRHAASAGGPKLGFLDFVRRGLAGQPGVPAPPVPLALSRAALALRDAAPPGAVPMPADAVTVDVELPGAYLDAKNRAAGLLDDGGPAGPDREKLVAPWRRPAGDVGGLELVVPALEESLGRQRGTAGASELANDVATYVRANGPGGDITPLLAWYRVAQALEDTRSTATVLKPTALYQRGVRSIAIPRSGPLADAVLAAVESPRAPLRAVDVAAMSREASADASGSAEGPLLPNRVLAQAGGSTSGGPATLSWDSAGGRRTLAPTHWLAFRRADGRLYWRAGPDGPVALTDGTLRGAGFTVSRGFLVEAARVGRILAVYELR